MGLLSSHCCLSLPVCFELISFSSVSATWFPPTTPVQSLMAASRDFTLRIYQAALILKLINNSDKTALSSACKDGRQSEEKLKEINSPLFLQHLNATLTGSITSTHHTLLSATRHQKSFLIEVPGGMGRTWDGWGSEPGGVGRRPTDQSWTSPSNVRWEEHVIPIPKQHPQMLNSERA